MTDKSLHQQRVEQFHTGFEAIDPLRPRDPEKPTTPVSQENRLQRARLVLEEALELVEALGLHVTCKTCSQYFLDPDCVDFDFWMAEEDLDLAEIAKECADVIVVTTGTLSRCGIPDKPILNAVDQNNLEKARGGWVDENGKFRKPPGFTKVDLEPLLRKLGWDE